MISPYLEKPLRSLEQALRERTAGRAALQETAPCGTAQPPAARCASDAGSAEAQALLQHDRPAAAEIERTQRAA